MKSEIQQFENALKVYLKENFNYKRLSNGLSFINNNLMFHTKKFDLYMRYKPNYEPWEKDTLVIAKIGFIEQKNGHGTSLIKFLLEKSNKYGFKFLAIESANKNSSAFAKKLGFKEIKENQWSASIEDIILKR
jgi:hypothetical protein